MRRVLCVWLPTFSTDLVKRRLERGRTDGPGRPDGRRAGPVVLTRAVNAREVVVHGCDGAARAGVRAGMDLAHARSLLPTRPEAHVDTHRPDRDAAALQALACRALRFSPLVAPDAPDGLWIDITGTERLHKGEDRLIRAVSGAMTRLGFGARVASASTYGCAWAVAHYGPHGLAIVAPGREREAIADLPVGALRLSPETADGLGEIGITHVGHLLKLPRSSLVGRFDEHLVRRVLQAVGDRPEHFEPVRPAPPLLVRRVFEGPTDRWESIEAAAREIVEEFSRDLARRQRGVRRVEMRLDRPHAAPTEVHVELSRPSCSARHIWSLLRSRLERIDVGDGVEGLCVLASRTARMAHHQQVHASCCNDDRHAAGESAWGELVDALAARLGADAVQRLEHAESHLPERAFRARPAIESRRLGPRPSALPRDRPTRLFDPPEPAAAMALTPDGPILSLAWRDRRWTVVTCRGPERIGPEWWRWSPPAGAGLAARTPVPAQAGSRRARTPAIAEAPPDRDYYIVRTECGRSLWVFRHGREERSDGGPWFVHGEWS